MPPQDSCVFCKIIRRELPGQLIAETNLSLAFMDLHPLSRGHCLVIPKEHKQTFGELSQESVVDLSLLLHKCAKAIDPTGEIPYNILQNNQSLAHQAVFHVHFHLIPKSCHGDGLGLRWSMLDMSEEDLKKAAKNMRAMISDNEKAAAAESEAKSEDKK